MLYMLSSSSWLVTESLLFDDFLDIFRFLVVSLDLLCLLLAIILLRRKPDCLVENLSLILINVISTHFNSKF